MIKISNFVDVVVKQEARRACFWGDCFVGNWEPFRQPIIGQFGILFGVTIIESGTLPEPVIYKQ